MLRIGICEDVFIELHRQKKMVKAIMARLAKNAEVFDFQSGEELLCEIENTGSMDILLLDIEMQGINGIDTAKIVRESDDMTVLIFISSYDQYCKEMIGVRPFAFIDKPLQEQELERTLRNVVKKRFNNAIERYVFYYQKMRYNIPLASIRFFQSEKRLVHVGVVPKDNLSEEYVFYGKLEDVETEIEGRSIKFLRVRKSFLANTLHIMEYCVDRIVMDDGTTIEISKNYKDSIKQYYFSMLKEQ